MSSSAPGTAQMQKYTLAKFIIARLAKNMKVILVPTALLLTVLCTLNASASGGTSSVRTQDTVIVVDSGAHGPRIVSVGHSEKVHWNNQVADGLIEYAQLKSRRVRLAWRLNSGASHADSRRASFVYECSAPRLRLTWEWTARAAAGPIEHDVRIENRSGEELWLLLSPGVQLSFALPKNDSFQHMFVEKGAETPSAVGTHMVDVTDGYEWSGDSSTYAINRPGMPREIVPWFLVQQKGSPKLGVYVGIEFSGRTRLSLAMNQRMLHIGAGLNLQSGSIRTRLKPNETFIAPTIFIGATTTEVDVTSNVLRRWIRQVLTNPQTWADQRYPWLVNNSWGSGMAVDETLARRMIQDSAELGLEMFHIDAGWFRSVGDWRPNPEKFPHGLASLADEAHARGLKFGLWADWAQAGLGTGSGALNVNNPEVRGWLPIDPPGTWKPEPFKGETIDLSVPMAKAWAERETNRIVADYRLDMLEHDGYLVLQGCTKTDHPHAPPDPLATRLEPEASWTFARSANSTDVSYHSTRAYYEIQSKLRENHPGLLLEVCNDGGRMVDFGSAAHADYFSITDTYDPLSNRRAFYDTSWLLPPAMLEAYVERWATPDLGTFRYMLRSGMMGWFSLMLDTTSWNSEQHAAAKEAIALYKEKLRPLIRDADLFHVSSRPDGVHWDAMQYFDRQRRRGVLFAFRGSTMMEMSHAFLLQGLRPDSSYHLTFHDHSSPDRSARGAELMTTGLIISLPQPNWSELVFLDEIE